MVAIEYDEFADDRLAASIREAEGAVDRLVHRMMGKQPQLLAAC